MVQYEVIMPGVFKSIPCTSTDDDKGYENFLERLNTQYEQKYGQPAPCYLVYHEYKRKKNHGANRTGTL